MKEFFLFSILVFSCSVVTSQSINPPYLSNETYTYSDLVDVYRNLERNSEIAKFKELGKSDIGKPIHLFIIDKDQDFSADQSKARKKSIVFINNGIHAGEACGIDASVELSKNLLDQQHPIHKALDSVVIVIIPIYNVGGMLNRGAYSRANQNGPKEHGFRGNAKNLDLNRDFIKCDSRNAKVFTQVFREWDPDFFIDTHTTNGSDHQYTLTLIATQKDKQNPILSEYAQKSMLPSFYRDMKDREMEMIPYVYNIGSSPEDGIMAFLEIPRYSSGYAALFDCFSFITEAHVFKTFENRVKHTIGFLETVVEYAASHTTEIINTRAKAKLRTVSQSTFPIKWQLDTTRVEKLPFNGYETGQKESEVTGQKMKFYDTDKPYKKEINYYNSYQAEIEVKKPVFYVVPQAYERVIERLMLNQVNMMELKSDTIIEVETYYILDYKSPKTPYEAHYLHSEIKVEKKLEKHQFYKGDVLIPTNQMSNRYLVETLEPESTDGFFAWNFFEGILQQKEWFSDYAFEPKAKKLLAEDSELKKEFESKKREDAEFAQNSWAQLYFIYQRSPYFEKTVNRYPICRVN
ncbi:MAG: hypothetical protein JKY48_17765 [Flavobacteriales bacterium]|nr:hypothetical protein [Flavobacteriales bacterium]